MQQRCCLIFQKLNENFLNLAKTGYYMEKISSITNIVIFLTALDLVYNDYSKPLAFCSK